MKNLTTNFETFVNEGIIPQGIKNWFKSPKEMDDIIKNMFKEIKYQFDIDRLEAQGVSRFKDINDADKFKIQDIEKMDSFYDFRIIYTLKDGTEIISDIFSLTIDGQDVTDYVNDHIIEELYDFLYKKLENYKNEYKYNIKKKHISEIRNKYSKYTNPNSIYDFDELPENDF